MSQSAYVFLRYYIGRKPRILITDLDILKQIMVKDFDNFSNCVVSQAWGREGEGGRERERERERESERERERVRVRERREREIIH